MKKTIAAVLSLTIVLAGCVTASTDVTESYAAPMQYRHYDREQPRAETGRIHAGASELAARLDPFSATTDCTSANFTSAIYYSIALGMTLDQVTQTIGCAARLFPVRDPLYMMYVWTADVSDVQSTNRIAVCFDETGIYVRVCRRQSYGSRIASSGVPSEGMRLE